MCAPSAAMRGDGRLPAPRTGRRARARDAATSERGTRSTWPSRRDATRTCDLARCPRPCSVYGLVVRPSRAEEDWSARSVARMGAAAALIPTTSIARVDRLQRAPPFTALRRLAGALAGPHTIKMCFAVCHGSGGGRSFAASTGCPSELSRSRRKRSPKAAKGAKRQHGTSPSKRPGLDLLSLPYVSATSRSRGRVAASLLHLGAEVRGT